MKELTSKEKRFLEAYAWAKKTYQKNPSLYKLASILGYKSINSIRQFISTLHKRGIDPETYSPDNPLPLEFTSTVMIPVLGSAPCGLPLFAEQNWEEELPVDTSLLSGNPNKYFFLKARGNSMDLAGIEDGDYVLFRSQPNAELGDKVVALLGDEVTIKYFKPGIGYVSLVPKSSNPMHKPILVADNIKIQGVVRYIVKKESLSSSFSIKQ